MENIVVDMACVAVVAEHSGVELDSVGTPEITICMIWVFALSCYGVGNFCLSGFDITIMETFS